MHHELVVITRTRKKWWLVPQPIRLKYNISLPKFSTTNIDNPYYARCSRFISFKKLTELKSCQYLYRTKLRKCKFNKFLMDRDCGNEDMLPHLTDREFLKRYCMSRDNFWGLVLLIKNHPVFEEKYVLGIQMASVDDQLMILWKHLGGRISNSSKS